MTNKTLKVGIVGAGLIGGKRACVIAATRGSKLVAVADLDVARAKALAAEYGAEHTNDWKKLVARKDVDAVVVAVPNAFAAQVVLAALKYGKHVLCEKPFGITSRESFVMLAAAKRAKKILKVGFNHRFHPAIWKAHELFERGVIGKVLFIRARYGHGGRLGMEKEWRFDKKISGGGELLDQGTHIVDLARWFAGEFHEAYGVAETKFWRTNLDDNTFAILKNKQATVAFHVSTMQWKNLFSFEVFGEKGFLAVQGLGGSYGAETLTHGKRKSTFGIPKAQEFQFFGDTSWEAEWKNFIGAVRGEAKLVGDAYDGFMTNKIVEAIYKSSRTKMVIGL